MLVQHTLHVFESLNSITRQIIIIKLHIRRRRPVVLLEKRAEFVKRGVTVEVK
ncbi:MAG: hypothetical protein FWH04_04905 [Oscillospiraceae bacterium]|nr:hypothetical protein [Oscillospiraceae bacterium]